jgi:predicted RNA-binding Zn ribbon-like protein
MRATKGTPAFQFMGGHVCLDFANTLDGRGGPDEVDLLQAHRDVVAFADATGIITAAEAQVAARAGERNPEQAEQVLRRSRQLREAIFAIFSSLAARQQPPGTALDKLNSVVREAGAHRVVSAAKDQFKWEWVRDDSRLDWVLWPIALAAGELLASEELALVRSCASETCDWLFLDRSKSHSRRWCDMGTCGNRNKARRFYRAQKRATAS